MAKLTGQNISMVSVKDFFAKAFKNLAWVFLGFFCLLLVFEALELKTSYNMIQSLNQEPVIISKSKGVRINFDAYNTVVNRIESAPTFEPSGGIVRNPFADSDAIPGSSGLIVVPSSTPPTSTSTATTTKQ